MAQVQKVPVPEAQGLRGGDSVGEVALQQLGAARPPRGPDLPHSGNSLPLWDYAVAGRRLSPQTFPV